MGILKKSVLGKPSGTVGDIMFRYKDGVTFISTRPVSFMPGADADSVNRRSRFGISAKFSSAVNSIPSLKNVWDDATPNNISPYNGIFKASYPFITPTDVSDTAKVVPFLFGFDVTTTTVTVNETTVAVAIDPIGTNAGIDTTVEKFIQLVAVIKCSEASLESLPQLLFIPLKSSNVSLNLTSALNFSITLSDQDSEIYSLFAAHVSYLALVTLTLDGKAVHYSSGFNNV